MKKRKSSVKQRKARRPVKQRKARRPVKQRKARRPVKQRKARRPVKRSSRRTFGAPRRLPSVKKYSAPFRKFLQPLSSRGREEVKVMALVRIQVSEFQYKITTKRKTMIVPKLVGIMRADMALGQSREYWDSIISMVYGEYELIGIYALRGNPYYTSPERQQIAHDIGLRPFKKGIRHDVKPKKKSSR